MLLRSGITCLVSRTLRQHKTIFQLQCGYLRHYASLDPNVVPSRYKAVDIPDVNICEFVWRRMDEWPDKTAVVCGISGKSFTYAQLRATSKRFASSLRRAGFKQGQVLAIVLPNTPDYPFVFLGAVEAGLVVTTVNPNYVSAEIAKQLLDSDARIIVCLPEKHADVLAGIRLAAESGYAQPTVVVTPSLEIKTLPRGAVDIREMLDKNIDVSNVDPNYKISHDTPVVLPYSSGTTGLPKGVVLSHRNLVANCLQLQCDERIALAEPTNGSYQDVLPAILPMYHIYGLVITLLSKLCIGSKIVTLPKFEPKTFLNVLKNHQPTVLYLVPPLVLFLGSSPDATSEHFRSLRFLLSGAAPLGEKDVLKLREKVPESVRCLQAYGLTETSPTVFHAEKDTKKLSSVGTCVSNIEAKVINEETGASLGVGQVGEVCCRGPMVMVGYYKNPKATAEVIDSEGWFHTGDLGYYDEDGDFFIVDRLKELIKVKGYQVAPAELEELLRSHPDVLDAAVIGIPDDRAGEVPLAHVVPRPGVDARRLAEEAKEFVASKTSAFKHLAGGVRIVESIPKSPAGKILRKVLREEHRRSKA